MGQIYQIKQTKDLKTDAGDAAGSCDGNAYLIEMDEDLDEPLYTHTLLHELTHAVFNEGGLDQTSISDDIQEVIAEQIARALIANFNIQPKGDDNV